MHILAINPWIIDFAAYNFWLKPYGFLILLDYLKLHNHKISFIDCLDSVSKKGLFGRSSYPWEIIEKPTILKNIPRHLKRYGISIERFYKLLPEEKPDLILITSSMTYWYLGIIQATQILREKFPKQPILIGGTYATLCYQHAKENIPEAEIIPINKMKKMFKEYFKIDWQENSFYTTLPRQEYYYPNLEFLVLKTSWGCPFCCAYCASKLLSPQPLRLSSEAIINYLDYYVNSCGIKDIVLYDDAFLYPPQEAKQLLEKIIRMNLKARFHTPNALHLKYIDISLTKLMKKAGFINPHFGIELTDPYLSKKWHSKISLQEIEEKINILKHGGYKKGEFSIYLLFGYPGQNFSKLIQAAEHFSNLGAKISLAEFSVVPGTEIYNKFAFKLHDPLLHNNSIYPFFPKEKIHQLWLIKNRIRAINKKFNS